MEDTKPFRWTENMKHTACNETIKYHFHILTSNKSNISQLYNAHSKFFIDQTCNEYSKYKYTGKNRFSLTFSH